VDVAALFAPQGPLARTLPSFETRSEQTRMALEVARALESGRHLLVEAGTGVGKSLAYLVPAVLWATREGASDHEDRRVVVSTHTRALQEQLARKDLPFLERVLGTVGITFRHALLMGSENYLCVQRLEEIRLKSGRLLDPGSEAIVRDLARHAGTAPSGLRSEIPFPVPDDLWSRLRRDRDICLGSRGPFWEACLYRRDLMRSREAHILVVNHALYFLDLATGGRILPDHAVVILDEAHRVEEAVTSQFGTTVSDRAVTRLLDDLGFPRRAGRRQVAGRRAPFEALSGTAAGVHEASERFFEEVRREAGALLSARARTDRGPGRWDGQVQIVRVRQPGLVPDHLRAPLEELESILTERTRASEDPAEALAYSSLAARARDLRERVTLFLEQRMPDAVYWVESVPSRGGMTLHAAPIEVAPVLRPRLFDGPRRVVLTSATLTAAGSFSHARRRLGIVSAAEAVLGSPYDFEAQALLYLPPRMPDPVSSPEEFVVAVVDQCRELLRASDGGAFVLFTSYALLARVHAVLSSDPALADLAWFRHEPGVASSILESFRMTRRGVLLGTLTFWQGVDVPGDALRSVIITRLPFEVPDHPIAEARAEAIRGRGGDPFSEDSLPEAILTFRQGFGRLIRGREDRGLVAILDPRVRTRSYGQAFLDALPPCRRISSTDAIARFLRAPGVRGDEES
jgi:ATP-dependent DNA helicase DinG